MPEVQDETLEVTASTDEVEQPVETDQAVETGEVVEQAPVADDKPAVETPAPRLYAGKYKTAEELEAAYQSTNAEASRMAAELGVYRRTSTPPTTKTEDKPQYTADQLETWKEGRLLEVSNAQIAAQQAYAQGNVEEARKFEGQARESARQIRLIDAELRKLDIQTTQKTQTRQSAEQRLVGEAVTVLQQYKDDLVPGTTLYNKASEYMMGYEAMGMDPQNPLVQAQAVSMAAQALGLSSKKVEQTTRKELTKSMSQALKQGVIQGAGKAAKSASAAPDFLKMTDAEFVAYKRQRGWD